jgi:MFS family permease
LITYRQEKAEWKRASSLLVPNESTVHTAHQDQVKAFDKPGNVLAEQVESNVSEIPIDPEEESTLESRHKRSNFRHFAAEVGFCFTIAMTQFLAEYLISGFAIELPNLLRSHVQVGPGSMGLFWPASLLSLILSATLLSWARLSDMYGGYFIFMFGVGWLAIWTLIPGFCSSLIWIDISRAMQGLAIAAFMPSTFSMVGSIYPEGPRKNFVLGLYSGCAPLGFFAGFLVAGALPVEKARWYWFVAAGLSLVTFITAFLSVPSDRTDRRKLGLKMDWIGSFLIMAGLVLVSYALSVEPYANQFKVGKPGFEFPIVIGPFSSGITCLAIAFWYEGWCATCPLLPFEFFKPKSVTAFSLACMCFYASYGVWLYNSAQLFQTPDIAPGQGIQPLSGMTLALWYTPTAIGGIILCIMGGLVMHVVPIMILLLISALAWIAAPLLLALAPLPLHYWEYVVPSMLCATIGIDLTFTVSIVFLSSVQPLRYQGLSGAVCSILVNLAMSFALSISEIVMEKAASRPAPEEVLVTWAYQATFIYAAASAGLGLLVCITFVRISRSVVQEQRVDEEMAPARSSDTTLVDPEDNRSDDQIHSERIVERNEM